MAEEFYFYPASMGIYSGNWWSSPRNTMFPGTGISSACFVDVSNFYVPGCYDSSGNGKPGFPSWDCDFPAMSAGNGFSPSTLSDLKEARFDGEKVAAKNICDASIPNQFSGDDSSASVQSFLFGASDLYSGGGILANNCNERNPPASVEDQFSNLEQLSAPSLPKLRSNSKPFGINKTRPSTKTTTTKLKARNTRSSTVHALAQQRPGTELPSDVGGTKRDVNTSTKGSTSMVESGLKRPRIEAPSPLPTFKVRKEKLGDRITALQQLVSPFGKTDTASVLHEAIDYIKFLHDQVHVLSAPYMKNGPPKGISDIGRGLRSRGLCLVPISGTLPVASETPVDFWTPTTLGGTNFR